MITHKTRAVKQEPDEEYSTHLIIGLLRLNSSFYSSFLRT